MVGVASSVAMYKTLDLIRRLQKEGAEVHVMMTRHAAKLISPQMFHAISQNRVWIKMFDEESSDPMPHVQILQEVDLVMVVPATASLIGHYAMGLAHDLVTTALLGAKAPVLLAPAMNSAMYEHSIVQENLDKLRSIGVTVVDPVEGKLACGSDGMGCLAPLKTILLYAERLLTQQDLKGKKVLISGGRTIEPLDPVRLLTNRSSGKMGLALARAAFSRGAEVVVVSGKVDVQYPAPIEVFSVKTAEEMREAVLTRFTDCDVFISAAAVCDYKPLNVSNSKLKKKGVKMALELIENPDILKEVSALKRKDQKVVGFALETNDLENNAKKKLKEKNLDLLIGNSPVVLDADEGEFSLFYERNHKSLKGNKVTLGHYLFDWLLDLRSSK